MKQLVEDITHMNLGGSGSIGSAGIVNNSSPQYSDNDIGSKNDAIDEISDQNRRQIILLRHKSG